MENLNVTGASLRLNKEDEQYWCLLVWLFSELVIHDFQAFTFACIHWFFYYLLLSLIWITQVQSSSCFTYFVDYRISLSCAWCIWILLNQLFDSQFMFEITQELHWRRNQCLDDILWLGTQVYSRLLKGGAPLMHLTCIVFIFDNGWIARCSVWMFHSPRCETVKLSEFLNCCCWLIFCQTPPRVE